MKDRLIFHIDVNSAFLSWEAVHRLSRDKNAADLRAIPSAVGGELKTRHGVILAKSHPAKAYGINTGEPVVNALKKCPSLYLVPPNHGLYEEYSKSLQELLYQYTPAIEPFSIDEAFLDMTSALPYGLTPLETAMTIAARVRNELNFTVNIGISSNKLLAKMASDFEKPDKIHTLFPSEISKKMWPLPLEELFFVGRSSARILKNLGLRTIGDIAATAPDLLKAHLGKKHGELIYAYSRGIDTSPVEVCPAAAKCIGNSLTLSQDITDFNNARQILLLLSESVGARLRKENVKAACITVEMRDCDFNNQTHQETLFLPTNTTDAIFQTACKLLKESWKGAPLRLLGVRAGKLEEKKEYTQLSLFSMKEDEKKEKLDQALDSIREKYGTDSIKRAALLKPKN
ncbi:DNA polymerase Y family protein [Anaerocolumna xylanovorans]|uniref:DNA polymerase IV n=1 Tax=Anaerocolumna xylanovorans DSM 12503 TaxID=1121345 RepID=A0A1M7Y740_9FIRM|nr:DNA polymerase IV [Anaerocolumna xylanovorans]SHO48467.1 DNA polymerase-4 [Anaerocolumna xylanovorans DSM 12503]